MRFPRRKKLANVILFCDLPPFYVHLLPERRMPLRGSLLKFDARCEFYIIAPFVVICGFIIDIVHIFLSLIHCCSRMNYDYYCVLLSEENSKDFIQKPSLSSQNKLKINNYNCRIK